MILYLDHFHSFGTKRKGPSENVERKRKKEIEAEEKYPWDPKLK